MRILIAGATGFIGRALVPRLQRDGHTIVAWVRSETRALALLGADVDIVSISAVQDALIAALSGCDAVVNLAGETLLARRWTPARRAALRASRIDLTTQLVSAIEVAVPRPRVLVSGSAVGFYGDRGDEVLDETSSPRDDFLSQLCRDWEAAAERSTTMGLRVVLLRSGVVLGRAGGALSQMLLPFKAGVGGPVGPGRQYFSWIHLDDLVNLIAVAVRDERYVGAVNAVAPDIVTSRTFARTLGRALRRPARLSTPTVALRGIFGEAAVVVLASQRVEPQVARRNGFVWTFPSLDAALRDVVRNDSVKIARVRTPVSTAPQATYVLTTSTVVASPIDQVFAFFSKPTNLGLMTPAAMQFRIVGAAPRLSEDATVELRAVIGRLPIRWRSQIIQWDPPRSFVAEQDSGPCRVWHHEHLFTSNDGVTTIEDRVYYTPPFGWLAHLLNQVFVARSLRSLFWYRAGVLRLRFGNP